MTKFGQVKITKPFKSLHCGIPQLHPIVTAPHCGIPQLHPIVAFRNCTPLWHNYPIVVATADNAVMAATAALWHVIMPQLRSSGSG